MVEPVWVSPDISGHSLESVHDLFRRWLGPTYDLQALDVVLAAAASERLGGDPPWLLVVSGSGAAKTESVVPLAGAGAVIVSTISGEGALLSGTSKKERSEDATGGLLRKLGSDGVLVIKDVTSVLSMNRDTRAAVLAALREIYDGRWSREMGSDGGQTLTWTGRIVVIGAVTTAWDSAHAVVSAMGDRFCLVRIDSHRNRRDAGLQALRNVNHETAMRQELSDAVGSLIKSVAAASGTDLTDGEMNSILDLADVITLARTAVERDGMGNVISAHSPEMPTRFAKQLAQLARGALALGMDRMQALNVALRCAGDSLPPLRLVVLGDVVRNPSSLTSAVVARLQLPRKTVDRVLQELHLLGLLNVGTVPYGETSVRWVYSLADEINHEVVRNLTGRKVGQECQ